MVGGGANANGVEGFADLENEMVKEVCALVAEKSVRCAGLEDYVLKEPFRNGVSLDILKRATPSPLIAVVRNHNNPFVPLRRPTERPENVNSKSVIGRRNVFWNQKSWRRLPRRFPLLAHATSPNPISHKRSHARPPKPSLDRFHCPSSSEMSASEQIVMKRFQHLGCEGGGDDVLPDGFLASSGIGGRPEVNEEICRVVDGEGWALSLEECALLRRETLRRRRWGVGRGDDHCP